MKNPRDEHSPEGKIIYIFAIFAKLELTKQKKATGKKFRFLFWRKLHLGFSCNLNTA